MPLFYFDTYDGDRAVIDDQGLELSGNAAARKAALATLPEMADDKLPDGDQRHFSVKVRDAVGNGVYEADLTLSGRWSSAYQLGSHSQAKQIPDKS